MKPSTQDPWDLWVRVCDDEPLSPDEENRFSAAMADETESAQAILDDKYIDGALRMVNSVSTDASRDAFVAGFLSRVESTEQMNADSIVGGDTGSSHKSVAAANHRATSVRRKDRALGFTLGATCALALVLVFASIGKHNVAKPGLNESNPLSKQSGDSRHRQQGTRLESETEPSLRNAQSTSDTPGTIGATLVDLRGPVFIGRPTGRVRVGVGTPLLPDDTLETGGSSQAVVEYKDGTRLELGRSTGIQLIDNKTLSGDATRTIHIEKGSVYAQVTPTSETIPKTRFTTNQASVNIVGTVLTIDALETETRVRVDHGSVLAGRLSDGKSVQLRDGQRTEIRAGADPKVDNIRGDILFLVLATGLNEGESMLRNRLEKAGWKVVVMEGAQAIASDGIGKKLVVISASVGSDDLDDAFRDLPVPILSSEPWFYDELGMTWSGEGSKHFSQTSIQIEMQHPLAAGFRDVVRVSHAPIPLRWGTPGPTALRIATAIDNPGLSPIFAYERGAAMQGFVAPARRVGFFLDDSPTTLTDEGWQLFDAAVAWCLEP
jgi:FecR protein